MLLIRDQHVENIRAGVDDHLLESFDHLVLLADLPSGDAEAPRDADEVGIDEVWQLAFSLANCLGQVHGAEVSMSAVALVKPVFPLDHHAQVLIIEHDHLDGQLLAIDGCELLDIHQEAAVAVDVDDQGAGEGGLGAHRGRQAVTH